MGDIADSLVDGEFDFLTGEYIGPGLGYPRTMQWDNGHTGPGPRAVVANFLRQRSQQLGRQFHVKEVLDAYGKEPAAICKDKASWKAFKQFFDTLVKS